MGIGLIFIASIHTYGNFNLMHIMERVKLDANLNMDPLFTDQQKKKLPRECPEFLIKLMELCCTPNPAFRPTFSHILQLLGRNYEEHYKNCLIERCLKYIERLRNRRKAKKRDFSSKEVESAAKAKDMQ